MIDPSIPLTDIHRHLDSNIRVQTILDLARQFNVTLPAQTLETLIPHVQVIDKAANLLGFLKKLDWGVAVLGSLDACRRVAYENVEDAVRAGLGYTELRFSPYYMAQRVIDGIQAGCRDYDTDIQLIGIMSRTFGSEACQKELNTLQACRDKIVALDLAGDELGFPGGLFTSHFCQARDNGWHITVHAGEAADAESIWQAIRQLGAERIGHGVAAIVDKTLMTHMAQQQIAIESCLTSNIQTSTVMSLAEHPLPHFLRHGIPRNH